MLNKQTTNTYWVKVYIAGPIEIAKQIIRQDVLREGLCVTIEPTLYIYTGGEEFGYVVGLVCYPPYPQEVSMIWNRAVDLATKLLEGTCQRSVLIVGQDKTLHLRKWEHGDDIFNAETA